MALARTARRKGARAPAARLHIHVVEHTEVTVARNFERPQKTKPKSRPDSPAHSLDVITNCEVLYRRWRESRLFGSFRHHAPKVMERSARMQGASLLSVQRRVTSCRNVARLKPPATEVAAVASLRRASAVAFRRPRLQRPVPHLQPELRPVRPAEHPQVAA